MEQNGNVSGSERAGRGRWNPHVIEAARTRLESAILELHRARVVVSQTREAHAKALNDQAGAEGALRRAAEEHRCAICGEDPPDRAAILA